MRLIPWTPHRGSEQYMFTPQKNQSQCKIGPAAKFNILTPGGYGVRTLG